MSIPEESRGKVILYLWFLMFTAHFWYQVAVDVEESVFILAGTGTNDANNPVPSILVGLLNLIIGSLSDSYFGKYPVIIACVLCYLLANIAMINLTFVQYFKLAITLHFFQALIASFIFVYAFAVIRVSCYMDLLKTNNFKLYSLLYVLSPAISPALVHISPLNGYYNIAIVSFAYLPILLWILYKIRKLNPFFEKDPERYGVIYELITTFINNFTSFKETSRYQIQLTNKFVDIVKALYFIVMINTTSYVLETCWKWQESFMAKGVIYKSEYIYEYCIGVSALLWYFSYRFMHARIGMITKVAFSSTFLTISLAFTIYLESKHDNATSTFFNKKDGFSQIRIYNGMSLLFMIKAPYEEDKFIKLGEYYKYDLKSRENYVFKRIKIIEISKSSKKSYEKIIYTKRGESSSYVLSNIGLVRVRGYDPIIKGPPGTNAIGNARIQIIPCEIGKIWIKKWYYLPPPGYSIIVSVPPGKFSYMLQRHHVQQNFSFITFKDTTYTLLVTFDKISKSFKAFNMTVFEPIDINNEILLFPIALAALATSNGIMLAFEFIFQNSPTSIRSTIIGVYMFYTSFCKAFASLIFTPGTSALWITLYLHLVNTTISLYGVIYWINRYTL